MTDHLLKHAVDAVCHLFSSTGCFVQTPNFICSFIGRRPEWDLITCYHEVYGCNKPRRVNGFSSRHRNRTTLTSASPDAFETSKMLCEQYYLTSPDMEVTEVNCKSEEKHNILFVFVFFFPSYLWDVDVMCRTQNRSF